MATAELLPDIISGASAGSIVAAICCTATDTEMVGVLERFPTSDLAVFDPPGIEGIHWFKERIHHAWDQRHDNSTHDVSDTASPARSTAVR